MNRAPGKRRPQRFAARESAGAFHRRKTRRFSAPSETKKRPASGRRKAQDKGDEEMDREFTPEDIEKNRTMAALGYIVFFLPLIRCGDSKLGRYCANQGLILLVLMVLVNLLCSIFSVIPAIGWIFTLIGGLAGFALLCVGILCFAQLMTNGRVIELPYVGGFRLLP